MFNIATLNLSYSEIKKRQESAVVIRAVEALNALKIEHYTAEFALDRVERLEKEMMYA